MSKNKGILHVINIFYSFSYLGNQFKHFSQKGYKQHIICSPSQYLPNYAKEQGVKYEQINIIRKVAPCVDIVAILKICSYIRRNKIGLVVGHTPKGAMLAMISAFIMSVPSRIYFRHGLVYETMNGLPRFLMMNSDRITSLLSTQIVCVSPSLAKRSLEDKLNPARKQIVLGRGTCGGIDAIGKFNPALIGQKKALVLRKSLNIDSNAFVIGYCGRLTRDKGIADLVQGFNILKSNMPGKTLKLLLVGDFDDRDALSLDVVKEIKNNQDIIYTGFIYDSIENYYSLMNVFVLPSYREGIGMVTLEAASMQIPVLTTKVTGCIDSIIEGETGFYVSNNPDDIAAGLQKLLDDPKIKQYGVKGREMVLKHFDNSILWPLIEENLYK